MLNRERAVDYLNMLDRLYVFDGYAGWDPEVKMFSIAQQYAALSTLWLAGLHNTCSTMHFSGQQVVKVLAGSPHQNTFPPMQARIKIRVVCARAYHALFMYNMLIRPTDQELLNFGKPDFTILNAGAFPVNRYTSYMSSSTSVDVSLK